MTESNKLRNRREFFFLWSWHLSVLHDFMYSLPYLISPIDIKVVYEKADVFFFYMSTVPCGIFLFLFNDIILWWRYTRKTENAIMHVFSNRKILFFINHTVLIEKWYLWNWLLIRNVKRLRKFWNPCKCYIVMTVQNRINARFSHKIV